MIYQKELTEFLEEANRHTYAGDAPHAASTRLMSNDFEYRSGDLIYHDTYFGPRDFLGNEIVYKNDKPIWGLNYYGYILDHKYTNDQVYGFLKQALIQPYDNILPVRGPRHFVEGEWEYKNAVEGELSRCKGEEMVAHNGIIIYRCWYHGGWIN